MDNDIYSYPKEHLRSSEGLNHLYVVLAHARQCPVTDVQAEAVALRDRLLSQFLHLRDEVHAVAATPLQNYLADLSSMIRCNLEWSTTSYRYINADQSSRSALFADSPTGDSRAPLPIPSVAWW